MTEAERADHDAFDARLRAMIAAGDMTPDEAEIEWDYHFNGWPTRDR